MFKHAMVRKPGRSIINGLTSSSLGIPLYEKAVEQHREYVAVLASCGVKIKSMEADEDFPDGCFVEDTAVVTEKMAVITNPGAPSRSGETVAVKQALEEFYDVFEYIKAPGTLEGGDILRVENHFYIGLSARTNAAGADQFLKIINMYGFSGEIVTLKKMLHLKTGVNYIGNNFMLVAGEFIDSTVFSGFKKIAVDEDEIYAANCLWVNDDVIMPAGFPKTKIKLEQSGFTIKEVRLGEFEKIDGGLSCLSLRF